MRLLTSCRELILILTLVSCAGVKLPEKADEERCVISVEYNKCRCHQYRVVPAFVGRVGDSYDKPMAYCDRRVSFSAESWIEFVLWFEESFQAVKDANKKNKKRFKKPRMFDHEDDEIQSLL